MAEVSKVGLPLCAPSVLPHGGVPITERHRTKRTKTRLRAMAHKTEDTWSVVQSKACKNWLSRGGEIVL